jgi:endo-1,4-beta-xylanase
MRLRSVVLARLAALILLAFPGSLAGQLVISWNNPPTRPTDGVEHRSFRSPSMGIDVGYSILLPPGYSTTQARYPVLYWLHGARGNESTSPPIVAPRVLDAIHTAAIPPIIVVFVNAGAETFYADSPDGTAQSETAFIRELIPHIDATYRTRNERGGRAIEGMSMGGAGALSQAMKHADIFNSVVAYAPALLEVVGEQEGSLTVAPIGGTHEGGSQRAAELMGRTGVAVKQVFGDRDAFAKYSPFSLVSVDAARLRSTLPVRIIIGTGDGLLNANEAFHDLMNSRGYYHDYFVLKDIAHQLRRLYQSMGVSGLQFHAAAGGWR